MRKFICAAAASLAVLGCVPPPGDGADEFDEDQQALSVGQNQGHFLVKPPYREPNESLRRDETDAYYRTVRVGADGKSGGTIASALGTLAAFQKLYRMNGSEDRTLYYNRGDLGLGRNMHCVDWLSEDGQIACYVSNYVAGTGEFAFGGSSNIALNNVLGDTTHPFATVAMVYRDRAGTFNKVFFVVYDKNGSCRTSPRSIDTRFSTTRSSSGSWTISGSGRSPGASSGSSPARSTCTCPPTASSRRCCRRRSGGPRFFCDRAVRGRHTDDARPKCLDG